MVLDARGIEISLNEHVRYVDTGTIGQVVDKKTIDELPLNLKEKFGVDVLLKMIKNTDVEQLIRDSGLLK